MNRLKRYILPFVLAAIGSLATYMALEIGLWTGYQQQFSQMDQQLQQLYSQQKMLHQAIEQQVRQQPTWQQQEQQLLLMRRRFRSACDAACVVNRFALLAKESLISIEQFDWQAQQSGSVLRITPFNVVLRGEYAQLLHFFEQLGQSLFVVVFEQARWQRVSDESALIEFSAQASLVRPFSAEEKGNED
jgi:Tfp pilus assembly protein PilO